MNSIQEFDFSEKLQSFLSSTLKLIRQYVKLLL